MKRFILHTYMLDSIKQYRDYWLLIFLGLLFFALRFPSLVEPSWYGDEGIYQVVGNALNEGRVLYRDIWDNKPPLLYIIYAFAQGNLFTVKFLSLVAGVLSVVGFYFLSQKLFEKRRIAIFSTLIFAILFGTPILEGNIANAENFMLLPTILAAFLVVSYTKKRQATLIFAGLLLSLSLLIKVVAIFDFAAFFAFLLLTQWQINKKMVKEAAIFLASFLSLLVATAIYFLSIGAFADFLGGVFAQNVMYVGEQYGSNFPQIILGVKTVLLVMFLLIIAKNKKKISKSSLFIYLWILFSLYNAYFSDRPYTHYLLVVLPAFSLLVGNFLNVAKKTRLIDLALIIGICLVSYFQFQIYSKNISYYNNFFQFISGNKSITSYQSFFDKNTPRDYSIANFIKTNTSEKDKVFLMSDSAQIYALSGKLPIGKYAVFYHITYYENADRQTKEVIEKEKPKYVIQTREGPEIFRAASSYELKYIMGETKIYERQI